MTTTITHIERSALIKAGIVIESAKARLFAEWHSDKATGATEGRFVMTGPSGRHSLLISATDTNRLNAHWQVFASHEQNR